MGKLNIAHHKSYHPYRKDNIERVRKDEEIARLEALKKEGRLTLADSEAKLDSLRKKSKTHMKRRTDDVIPESSLPIDPSSESLMTPSGHINFFAGLESSQMPLQHPGALMLEKKAKEAEAERGFALAPDPKDLRPWYSTPISNEEEITIKGDDVDSEAKARLYREQQKKTRESQRKESNDPMREVQTYFEKRKTKPSTFDMRPPLSSKNMKSSDGVSSRLSRETSERARAEALIQARRRAEESEFGSSIGEDTPIRGEGYGDMYNRTATLEAHQYRRPLDRRRGT